MVSRGHVLYLLLLPVLAQVAADDSEEQMMSEVMTGDRDSPASRAASPLMSAPADTPPLPPALLIQLLQSSDPQRGLVEGSAPASLPLPPPSSPNHLQPSHTSDEYDDTNSENNNSEVNKRVFCNGFTGCGGRHRDRSRRQERYYGKRLIPLLVKRPFCNSFGCYNGKRSPSATRSLSLVEPANTFQARALARLLAAAAKSARHSPRIGGGERGVLPLGGSDAGRLGKRLFCNGYGGCRSGKRSLFSPWMSKMNGVVGDRR